MSDMLATIVPKSDQLNADDLLGGPRTIKITRVEISPGTEQPVSLFYEGDDGKPYKACKSMRRVLVQVWGADAKAYTGRRMTIYCDPGVVFGGQKVGGIRISHMSHIDGPVTMALTATRANRKPYTVKPLADDVPAERKQTVSGWLDSLAAELTGLQTQDEIAERVGREDVQRALSALKGGALARLNAIILMAHEQRAAPEIPKAASEDELSRIRKLADEATSEDAVAALGDHPLVRKALTTGSKDLKDDVNALLADAMARVRAG